MQTFDEAINAATPQELQLAELKETFSQTLVELREQQRHTFPKQKAGWLPRVAFVQIQEQKAAARGVSHSRVAHLREKLCGGRDPSGGLLLSTENQIAAAIQNIEGLNTRQLPERAWVLSLYREPQNIRDNMAAIDAYLTELESLVKDDGDLQRMVEAKSVQPGPVTPAGTVA